MLNLLIYNKLAKTTDKRPIKTTLIGDAVELSFVVCCAGGCEGESVGASVGDMVGGCEKAQVPASESMQRGMPATISSSDVKRAINSQSSSACDERT